MGCDVIVGVLLGVDEFGFLIVLLIVVGCLMMCKCYLNICLVGIVIQDLVLCKCFKGMLEYVINYFFYVVEEVCEIMVSFGVEKFDDLIGCFDFFDKEVVFEYWKVNGLDFFCIFF